MRNTTATLAHWMGAHYNFSVICMWTAFVVQPQQMLSSAMSTCSGTSRAELGHTLHLQRREM